MGRHQMTFSVEMEQKLVAYIKKVDNMFYGLTRCEVMCLAFQFAEKNNIPRQFSRDYFVKDFVCDLCK